jgi:DNA-binding response OmpR family regulator
MAHQSHKSTETDVPAGAGFTLLIIDDEELNHQVIKMSLQEGGYRLLFAHTGRKGIELAKKQSPDLVLLDVRMPVMDGLEVCKILKADPETADVPVIFLTALNHSADKVEGFRVGGIDYIVKPFVGDELEARIQAHLGQSRVIRALKSTIKVTQQRAANGESGRLSAKRRERAERAGALLLAQLTSPPSPSKLAELLDISVKQLNRDFKACYGIPMQTWLRDQRMQEARRLLRHSQLPIECIAHKAGYTAHANFSIAFKRRYKITPREYRMGMDAEGADSEGTDA